MIRISQIKIKPNHTPEELESKLLNLLRIKKDDLVSYRIQKQSLDARKKPDIYYVYTVDAAVRNESALKRQIKKNSNICIAADKSYQFSPSGRQPLLWRPVIIGSGPAGLFCAYMLAQHGYRPILIERGAPVEERRGDIEKFWKTGLLKPDSNVQFGEGGAGTFSDGKLNTLVKDPFGRNKEVLKIFVKHGAPEEILYVNKPHVGTDLLTGIVKNIREAIIAYGGMVRFHTKVTDIKLQNGSLSQLVLNDCEMLDTQIAVLAIGHSARDTFRMLSAADIHMEAKSFAVGVRIEHPQNMIDRSQYGAVDFKMPAAAYKLTGQLEGGRSVYTFCMCPGGYVVNASSEAQCLAVNGMSYHDRGSENANSAVIVTVSPDDYPGTDPLAGISFQRELEAKAYQLGEGKIPLQRFDDFCKNRITSQLGDVKPQLKGQYNFANLRELFPENIGDALESGIKKFDDKIHGFSRKDALLSGVESRTSSPVRITRDEEFVSSVGGLYPCGEGAGYAGGITSAAMDGIKTAEMIARKYRNFD